ncbi:serine/threonine-protein kinase ULK4-like isoform X2 [Gigantopelta aegis]|uniref:serine/threonine-protein kinase ULK4-like isoform X2 n=1 Tax=Gigantopelta aegis TaxID=1735272 RepID=UPI001B88E1D3|nr:serine/threonine-protein kinase ULK4-like isoform X2 [Gigantopelta aegis]
MENFVLYEELGKGENAITYKGRRKGTINFVAIHCIDKCKRPEVTNTVRITHDISHNNVVKFYEWYETSNHLWLVAELCTGGSLDLLIKQDGNLPESSIRTFGQDLVTGLHYIHSLGILFNDLQPSKVLLDSLGVLKFANFGLSKVEGENLQELFLKFADAGEQWNQETFEEDLKKINSTGCLTYMAPEVMAGQEPSVLSDLWSFGCVLYEMFTGHPPFLAESDEQLKEKVMNKPFPPPRVKGTRFSGMASPDFLSLIEGLLEKDFLKRIGWSGLVTHPFWQGCLSQLSKDFTTSQEIRDSSVTTGRSSVFEHGGSSALGKIKGVELRRSMERPVSNLDAIDATNRPGSTLGDYMRPKTAPGNNGEETLFTLSARPHTAVPPDDRVTSPHKHIHSPMATREVVGATKDEDVTDASQSELLSYMFHSSDFIISPIVDNPKIQKPQSAKFDSKVLPVPPYSVEKLTALSEKDLTKHMKQILDNISQPEKGPPSQKRIHLLHYVASIASSPFVASLLLQSNALSIMGRQLKDTPHVEVRIKLGRVMALVALHGEDLDEGTNVSEAMTTLTEIVRENVKNTKLKQGLFPALGEILYRVAVQEQIRGQSVDNWSVPSMTYTVIARSCRDGEDTTLNHIAAKIVENVSATKGVHAQKFVHNEMAQSLWYLFKHSTVDAVRCTALSALCRLTWHNAQVFQSVIDTVGLSAVLAALMLGISRVQQSIVTMFGALLASGSHLTRLIQDKDFLQKIMRLLESPSTIIRAKAFLVLYHFIRNNTDVLLNSCQARLVMYIERDSRRQTPRETRGDNQESWAFMGQCLDLLVNHIVNAVPSIFKDILSALDAVGGRKHPSAVQVKQLKISLPHLPIFLHLVTSQVFRGRTVTEEFVMNLGRLLVHVNSIESGQTNIESASASIGVGEFVTTVMSILEGISQHPTLLIEHHQNIIETILPTLAALMNCQNVDMKASSLRLFSQIASVYLSGDQYGASDSTVSIAQLHKIIAEHLLPLYEQILLDQDPLPSYGLKLLLAILEQNPAFIAQFERQGLVQVVFQVLLDHQNNPTSGAMQCIVGILNCLVSHRETNMQELYDQGLIDYLSTLFFEVSAVCLEGEDSCRDVKTANTMLQTLLDCLQSLFKQVSEVVRKALQAKKSGVEGSGHDAEVAEQLLLVNKPLTDLTSLLTHLLCYEDTDIQDLSTKCLSLIVQLFGGENRDALSEENMEYYSKALKKSEAKKQKVLLRIIKRLVSTEKHHADSMRNHGDILAQTIKSLVHTASSHADVALSSVAAEILKATGHLT